MHRLELVYVETNLPLPIPSQPTSQPASQPTNQPASQPANQPANQPASQPANQPASQPANQPASQPATQPPTTPAPSHPATQGGESVSYEAKWQKTGGVTRAILSIKNLVFYRCLCALANVVKMHGKCEKRKKNTFYQVKCFGQSHVLRFS